MLITSEILITNRATTMSNNRRTNGTPCIGINGFGRIGKLLARAVIQKNMFRIAAINDPMVDLHGMAYVLKHDSVHGPFCCEVTVNEANHSLMVGGQEIRVFTEMDPSRVPWGQMGVDIVAECSGKFTTSEKCQAHKTSGAKRVLLSAPAKDMDTPTFVVGVNHHEYNPETMSIVSNASCTTNCLAPMVKLLQDKYGIEEGLMTTVHAMTASQSIVDGFHCGKGDPRSARCATRNIIPTSTGATTAVTKVMPELEGRLTGMAFRVPVENVSVVDLTVRLKRPMGTMDELEHEIRQIEDNPMHPMHRILGMTKEPVVSSDFNGDERSCIIDMTASMMLTPHFVKIIGYYDNEWAYAVRMAEMMQIMCKPVCKSGCK